MIQNDLSQEGLSEIEEIRIRQKLLTGSEVAQILNISITFAYKLMRQREIPTVRLGRSVRVRMQDLEKFIAEKAA